MNSKRTRIFLSFAFALTWLAWWGLSYLTRVGLIEFQSTLGVAILIAGGSAPTLAAYVAVFLTRSANCLREFNSRVFRLKVQLDYYLFALFVPVVLGIFSLGIALIRDGQCPLNNPLQPSSIIIFIPALLISVVMGGIEEVGWRGILQHELTGKLNLMAANFIIGIIWALWHLPLFYVVGSNHHGNSFLFFALAGIGYSGFMTWLYAKTESVFLCVLFHAAINATASIGLMVSMGETSYPYSSVFILAAGLVLLLPLHLKRKA